MKRYLQMLYIQWILTVQPIRLLLLFLCSFIAAYFFAGDYVHFVRYYNVCWPEAMTACLSSYYGTVFAYIPLFLTLSSSCLKPDSTSLPYLTASGIRSFVFSRISLIFAQAIFCFLSLLLGASSYLFQDLRFFNQWAFPGAIFLPGDILPAERPFFDFLTSISPGRALLLQGCLFVGYASLLGSLGLLLSIFSRNSTLGIAGAALIHFLQIAPYSSFQPWISFWSLLKTELIHQWATGNSALRTSKLLYFLLLLTFFILIILYELRRHDWLERERDDTI